MCVFIIFIIYNNCRTFSLLFTLNLTPSSIFLVKIKRFNEIFPDAYFIFWGCFRRNMFFECITSFIYLFIIIVTVFMVLSHLKEIFSDLF